MMNPAAFNPRLCRFVQVACLIAATSGTSALAQSASNPTPANSATAQQKSNDPKEITPVLAEKPVSSSPFQFDVGIPAWASAINGTVGIKHVTGTVSETFSSIWDHVDAIVPLA